MEETGRPKRPSGVARALYRVPIHLYRWNLGWLMGRRFLMLNHIGRRSGLMRRVVVEVVDRDAAQGTYTVCSGFGPGSDWYRNLLAEPKAVIQIGNKRMKVTAHPLDAESGADTMARYARRHPRSARALAGFMGFRVDGSEADFREAGRRLPFIRFEPRQ
ncbi:nitroreductase family deazaflavin-dependent oxidoreductase [Nocardiopsis sp. RSe5-2]|uniref:Nitroreductase family deazaflavin-dependent oxidoreductase n=1 Tax=Nocardiopsis endophytica TaxID=3018445 RepID=A0ABT4U8S2_9ACTN|nr:nitroreductase family deazaflavin-dependent oxidoreductase [Nocardiopsis endophytica]MDA2813356.1 nitroreductase family deazaflavin-dependent oxidoreductase [Nocardiopsis endophytica]